MNMSMLPLGRSIVVMFLVILGFVAGFLGNPAIEKADFERIKIGMKDSDVHRVLGGPPGNYPTFQPPGFFHIKSVRPKGTQKKWTGDGGIIFVWFDDNGVVIDMEFDPAPWPAPTLISRIKSVLDSW